MNPNIAQAAQDASAGLEEEEDAVDYDSVYGGLDVDTQYQKSPQLQNSYAEILGDVAKQFSKETLIGAGGTWGDLVELAGARQEQPLREAEKNYEDFATLEKMADPDYKPSIYDIASLQDDSDGPPAIRLPTTQGLSELSDAIGGPGAPKTTAGKYAGRSGRLFGAGLAAGQVNPVPAVAAGVAGQAAEEEGYGPLAQAAVEIATLIATGGKGGRPVSSTKDEIAAKINQMRQLGYTEEEITLAINSASKGKAGGVKATKGSATEEAFENFATKSDQLVNDILVQEIPGIEQGIQNVHKMASDAYGLVADSAKSLTITDSKPFLKAAKNVVDHLQNTLGSNPEASAFIKRISEAAMDATQYPSADKFINFYKELNSMGKWIGKSERDMLITKVKDGIKDTFKGEGKKGRQLAEDFERVNKGIQKAYKAQDASELIQKVTTQDGIDYKKFKNLFDKPENIKIFEDALGKTQTKNLNFIAKTGKEIKDFDKAWKAVNPFQLGTAADIGRGALGSYYLYKGDWEGLSKVAATKIGAAGIRKLAEKSLTDPKFQNLLIKGLNSIKNGSTKTFASANEAMKKYLLEEGIDIDLD